MGYRLRTNARHVHASENKIINTLRSVLQTDAILSTYSYFQFDQNKRNKHTILFSTFKL